MKRKLVLFLCMTAAAALLAGGCGSADKNSGSADAESSASADSSEASGEEKVYTAADVLAPLSYDVTDYVTLCDYTNLEITLDTSYEVTDADIDEQLQAMAVMYPNIWAASDKTTVEDGDMVTIDYTGYLDGETFEGGSGEDYDLVIGSDSFVDGFEDGLIGVSLGDTVSVDVTFPEDYGVDSLNGQPVRFDVTINAIKVKQEITYEEISDQWVKDNFYSSMQVSTLDEFRTYLKSYLESLNESSQSSDEDTAAVNQLLSESTVMIPDGYLETRIASYKESVYQLVEESGQTFEERMGVTEEEFLNTLPANMENRVKKDLILEALVKDMGITFTQSEFDDYVNTYMTTYSYDTPEELYAAFDGASELSGEEYVLLGYAEHQAWSKLKANITVAE